MADTLCLNLLRHITGQQNAQLSVHAEYSCGLQIIDKDFTCFTGLCQQVLHKGNQPFAYLEGELGLEFFISRPVKKGGTAITAMPPFGSSILFTLCYYLRTIMSSRPGPLETRVMGTSISFSTNSMYFRQFSGSSS